MKKWNHYHCHFCGEVTIARHDDEGVTPFMIRCRATQNCNGMAESHFFSGPQHDDQNPHVIFFRPGTLVEALNEIEKEKDRQTRKWLLEHYQKGGSLMREAPLMLQPDTKQ